MGREGFDAVPGLRPEQASSPGTSPATGDPPYHQALLYGSVDEFVGATVPFVEAGMRAGDEVVVASCREHFSALCERLDSGDAAAVDFHDADGKREPVVQLLGTWRERWRSSVHTGRRVRAVHEPAVGSASPDEVRELCRSDTALNNLWRLPGVTLLCAFDRSLLGADLCRDVRRCHPDLLEGGRAHASTEYADPEEVLSEERHGAPLPPIPDSARCMVSPEDPSAIRSFVSRVAEAAGLSGPRLSDFVVAVHEVVANAMTKAVIDRVHVWSEESRVVCDVRDCGNGLADVLTGYRPPDIHKSSGRGLWLARQLSDLVQVRTGPQGTTVRVHARVVEQVPG